MSRLIVIEGIDGSGKSTQFKLLCSRLEKDGTKLRRLTFPQYQEESSALIRMYLNGEFGDNPEDVNPYASSTFFAVDRFASYAKVWRDDYNDGTLVLTDRYTTSNAIHQGSKLRGKARTDFFKWLYEFEFDLMGLPKPDVVLYMDIPADAAIERVKSRRDATGVAADIHEADTAYLKECLKCGDQAAAHYGWRRIPCFDGQTARTELDIHEEIYKIISQLEQC